MARSVSSYVPSPLLASVASPKPSMEIAGMKFCTRSISWANSSSIREAFVNVLNTQSLCSSHRRMISFLRMRGSPPVIR